MPAQYRYPEAIISTEILANRLGEPRLRIFECTTYLDYLPPGNEAPYRVVSGRADYAQGHIPGAGFLDIQNELSNPDSPPHLRFTLPALDDLARRLAERGIGDSNQVVLYSRGRLVWATRVWWMLRAVGFDSAAVLDGGYEKWIREGRPTETDEPHFPPATLSSQTRPDIFVGKDAVLNAIESGNVCLVNALEPDLHRGENPRYGRPGRIPGSVNVPSSALMNTATNTLVGADQASEEFERAGANPAQPTLAYCGGGIAATLDAFILHQLGQDEISIYDASMSEWARDDSLPIERD